MKSEMLLQERTGNILHPVGAGASSRRLDLHVIIHDRRGFILQKRIRLVSVVKV